MDKTARRECFNYVSCKNTPTRALYPVSCVWFAVVFALTTASVLVLLHRVFVLEGLSTTQKWIKLLGGNVLTTFLVKTISSERFIHLHVVGFCCCCCSGCGIVSTNLYQGRVSYDCQMLLSGKTQQYTQRQSAYTRLLLQQRQKVEGFQKLPIPIEQIRRHALCWRRWVQ